MGMIEVSTEVIEQPPTWHKSVHEYLEDYNLKCRKATPMQGGASAYIWKIEGLTKEGSSPGPKPADRAASEACILKYGDETAKNVASLEMAPDRMLSEARAMKSKILAHVCAEEPSVEIPRLISKTDQAVIMSWAGDTDLRSAYINDKSLDARDVGTRIGKWIASLHLAGIDDPEVHDWHSPTIDRLLVQEEKNLRAKLSEDSNFTEEDVQKATAAVYNRSDVPKTLTAWDFRPMNTLLRMGKSTAQPRVTIVDWELASYGDPAFDLRLWAAEAIVLESQYGSDRGLLESFLTAYRQRAGQGIVDLDFVCRVAILLASMWELTMPCALWNVEEKHAESWRKQGREYVRAGIEADREWLAQSRLGPLLQ